MSAHIRVKTVSMLWLISPLVLVTVAVGCGASSKKNDVPTGDGQTPMPMTTPTPALPITTVPTPMPVTPTPINAGDSVPAASLLDFLAWTPVLAGDKAFESKGHGGILVRAYLNPKATQHVREASATYPLPEGSMLAKAVVSTMDTPSSEASRVYFMRKEAPGFDPENGDWSYALAKRVAGKLERDTSVKPKEALCISCHVKFKAFDSVQTVDFYKRQSTAP